MYQVRHAETLMCISFFVRSLIFSSSGLSSKHGDDELPLYLWFFLLSPQPKKRIIFSHKRSMPHSQTPILLLEYLLSSLGTQKQGRSRRELGRAPKYFGAGCVHKGGAKIGFPPFELAPHFASNFVITRVAAGSPPYMYACNIGSPDIRDPRNTVGAARRVLTRSVRPLSNRTPTQTQVVHAPLGARSPRNEPYALP